MDELDKNGIILTKDLAFYRNATTHDIIGVPASSLQWNVPTVSFIPATDAVHTFL